MSMFFILMALIVAAIAFFHYTQGLFSATLSAILAIFSAVLAISYHESIVDAFLGGAMADSAQAMVVLVLFATIYTILRTAFDQLVPGGVSLPAMYNKIGGAAMGLVAGIFAAGVVAFAAQTMSFNAAIMGYSRLQTEESTASIQESPDKPKRMQHPLYDFVQTSNPLHAAEDDLRVKMLLPVDDIVIDTTARLSDRGALSTSKPLASVHPDWLMELFGQRLGIEPAGKRVAMNLPGGKQTDVMAVGGKEAAHPDAGVYFIDHPLPQRVGEQIEISKIRMGENELFRAATAKQIAIVIRVYFGTKAMDPKNNLIEVSCGAVRLCTQRPSQASPDEMEWGNYFPVGTLEDNGIVFRQRPDDYLFLDPTDTPAVDFVFIVDAAGFLQEGKPPTPPQGGVIPPADVKAFLSKAKISEGTFLEVKRMAREDLSNQSLQEFSGLARGKSTLLRKELVKKPPKPAVDNTAAAVDPEALAQMSKKLVGTWEGNAQISGVDTTMTVTFQQNGTISGTVVGTKGVIKKTGALSGTWKATEAVDNSTIRLNASLGVLPDRPPPDKVLVRFEGDDQISMIEKNGEGQSITYARKSGSAPATPGSTGNNTPPTTPVVQAYPNLVFLTLPEENPKFYQAISVPAGTSGEATVDGGKVTVLEGKIAALSLNDADPAKLRGAGDQINRFTQPEGSVLMQAEAVQAGAPFAFKDQLGELVGVDAAGKTYPVVGFWAVVNGKLVARYNPDGGLSLSDYQGTVKPSRIWFMFKGAENAPITKIMVGQQPVTVKP